MTFKTFTVAGAVAALALTSATGAFAQAPAASAPKPGQASAPQVSHGAPIAGICTFSGDAAIGGSTVGKYVFTRLEQLRGQAEAEISGEDTALKNEARTLDGQRTTLDQNTLEQRAAALQVRANALQRKVQLRNAEMQRTQEKALGRLSQEIAPLIAQAYQAKQCSLLINRDALTLNLGNPAMDITGQVVTALNAKITQFAFDRERLDQAPATAQAAPRPAAATPTPAPAQPQRR